jgi:hypothetical protein
LVYLYKFVPILAGFFLLSYTKSVQKGPEQTCFAPYDLEIDTGSERLYIAGERSREIRSYTLPGLGSYQRLVTRKAPKSLALSGEDLFVACSDGSGELLILDKNSLRVRARIQVGHGTCDVVVSPQLQKAYTANQYSHDISVVDLEGNIETRKIAARRQPRQLELSLDGRYLFVANFLPAGRADVDTVASEISIIDLQSEETIKHIRLANGSNALRGMCMAADGKYLFISHNLGRFQVPTTQLEQGWMNTNALSIIDANSLRFVATLLLDEPDYGAAGSWGIDCNARYIFVAHSGTHDFSRIDYTALCKKLEDAPDKAGLSYDLQFMTGIRTRTKIIGNGPRALHCYKDRVYVANYFTGNLNIAEYGSNGSISIRDVPLQEIHEMDDVWLGEMYFNDATYCFQGWQSCNGCHPDEARVDGLNWDLLNDGMGNPKNCKSLLFSHVTPPAMITGVRESAEVAVRSGFRYIQFVQVEDSVADAVDKYLRSLEPVPSPHLVNGRLSRKAGKGKKVFEKAGCADCHPGPLFTDLLKHNLGGQGGNLLQEEWDTPSLIEVWRTGPYLYDGRCGTMKEVFAREQHGLQTPLSGKKLEQLVAYVLSL